jgi:RHS repeat-associated protein
MIAAKAFDPVMGVDIHIIQPPGPVPPVPIPHPFIGMLVDPMDFAPVIGATVMVNGMPRATAGTGGKCIPPHIPIGGVFVKPPASECEIFMGSSTVLADGDPLSFLGMPCLSCHDVGMPPPPRPKKKRKTKSLTLPTSVVLAVPAGGLVLVGGPPTVSMMALGMKAAMAGLGKAFKKLKKLQKASKKMKALSDKVQRAAKKAMDKLGVPPNVQNRVHRSICSVTGHPVDVATGKVFTENVDFDLPGPIPLRWERVWYSCSEYTGPLGHGWHHSYDIALLEENDVVAVRLPDGRPVAFTAPREGEQYFNRAERLSLRRHAGDLWLSDTSLGWTYRFTPPTSIGVQFVAELRDLAGNRVAFHYDHYARLDVIVDSVGREIHLQYDTFGRIERVLLPHPDSAGHQIPVARYRYDDRNRLVAAIDATEATTSYEYDGHLLVREVDPTGFGFNFQYAELEGLRRCVETWGDGPIIRRSLAYDPAAGLTKQTDGNGAVTIFFHSASGLVHEVRDALDAVTRFLYDDDGYLVAYTDALNNTATFEYDSRGNRTTIVDAAGATTALTYNSLDLPVQLVDANGGTWRRTYDRDGQLCETTDPIGRTWKYDRDERGRLISVVSPNGGSVHFRYGPTGSATELVDFTGRAYQCSYDYWGRMVRRTDADGNSSTFAYDLCGRRTSILLPTGDYFGYEYDRGGNIVRYVEPGGRYIRYRFHGYHQLREMVDTDGLLWRYWYDNEARLIQMQDAAGHTWKWEYDEVGNVIVEERPDNGITRYRYDQARRLEEVVDAVGQRVSFVRDPVGRILVRSGGTELTESFGYDAIGNLVVASNGSTEIHWSYDEISRVVAETSDAGAVVSEYDALGNRTRVSTPHSDTSYNYNVGSELVNVRLSDGSTVSVERGSGGDIAALEWSPGLRSEREYDELGRRVQQRLTTRHGIAISAETIRYAPLAEPLRIDRSGGVTGVDLTYDTRGYLRSARWDHDETELFSTDAGGWIRDIHRLGGQPAPPARLERDPVGRAVLRRTAEGDMRFVYDGFNRLTNVKLEDGREERYVYDALGRRVERHTAEGSVFRYLWDGARLSSEQNGQAAVAFVYDDEDAPLAIVRANTACFLESDHLGRPTTACSSRLEPVWTAEFYVYGAIRNETQPGNDPGLRFPGQQHDRATGLHYNFQRYYDPEAGQYLTPDPIGVLDGGLAWNYTPNPLAWIDPWGLIIVYRNLRPDEDPSQGLQARRPGRGMSPAGHVMNGSKPTFKGSQYISTTTDPAVADQWRQPGQRTVAIDTDLVEADAAGNKSVVDLSSPEKAQAAGLKGRPARYAVASKEVLVEGRVPPRAITQVCP